MGIEVTPSLPKESKVLLSLGISWSPLEYADGVANLECLAILVGSTSSKLRRG